jgi:heparan-alpha-glucosaminide N-acetyltransferase
MSAAPASSIGMAGLATPSSRIVSIDIFRGITIAVMVFVNDLASVHGLSKWTYHMPAQVDAMTYVDMVFPAFLFIVGMALPIAVRQRLNRNPSAGALWLHIVLRAAALLVIGLVLANVESCDCTRMHIHPDAWGLIGLTGTVLLWNVYRGLSRKVAWPLRAAGAALIIFVLAIFRRSTQTGPAWLDFSYPEILGLIGLTYFAVCLLYIPTRRWRLAPLIAFVAMIALNAAAAAHWLQIKGVTQYIWPFGNGALPSIVLAGVITAQIFLDDHHWPGTLKKGWLGFLFALACFVAGWTLKPLGISKIRATPTWALWSIAASCVLFTALYWICDVRHHTRWAWLVRPAGTNTLLTYLIPDIYYFLAGLTGLGSLLGHWDAGWPGVIRAATFAIGVLFLSLVLTKARLRLRL